MAENIDQTTKKAQDGISGAGKTITSTLGNTLSGVINTGGGVIGAGGKGLGETVTDITSEAGRPVGDGLQNITGGIENAARSVGKGFKDAGEQKKPEPSS